MIQGYTDIKQSKKLAESEDERIRESIVGFLKTISSLRDGQTLCNEDFDTKVILEWVAWLEKQSNKSQGKSVLEAIKEEKIDNTDIVEPKFKIGDWVVTSYGKVNQVISVDEYGYGYTLDNGFYFSGSWCDVYHLWTIKDAKDGNVLVSANNQPFIYNGKYTDSTIGAHIGISYDGEEVFIAEGYNWTANKDVKPATKEQCDLLFAKMKEAGYEWDVDKKELIKL